MPNHVANRIYIEADDELRREILEAVKFDDIGIGSMDFEKIVPMPPDLDIEESSRSNEALEICREMLERGIRIDIMEKDGGINIEVSGEDQASVNAFSMKYLKRISEDRELIDIGKKLLNNIAEYGYPSWYDWRIANWGTKWNSYGYENRPPYEQGSGAIGFDTAWGAARPVARKLSELYPAALFRHAWADEDIGQNVGEEIYQNGRLINSYCPEGCSAGAYRFAIELRKSGEWAVAKDGSGIVFTESPDFRIIDFNGRQILYTDRELAEREVPETLSLAYLHLSADGKHIAAFPKSHMFDGLKFLGSILSKESLYPDSVPLHVVCANKFPDVVSKSASIGDYLRGAEPAPSERHMAEDEGMKLA